MLQVSHIRENKEQVIKALAKRNLDVRELVEEVISLDEKEETLKLS
jgi:seryl-tRNA synthetase